MIDIPCKCGHSKDVHGFMFAPNFCFKCYKLVSRKRRGIGCYNYTPDNLALVEKLAKERNLV